MRRVFRGAGEAVGVVWCVRARTLRFWAEAGRWRAEIAADARESVAGEGWALESVTAAGAGGCCGGQEVFGHREVRGSTHFACLG